MSTSLISSSLSVGVHTIKNRIVVPAMADFGMTGQDCMVNDRHIRRYAAYAEGGAGLIIIEACSVTRFAENRGTIVLDIDACLPGLSALAKALAGNGATALVQIMLTGLSVMPENSIAKISREKFLQYKADFIAAAVRCKAAGFHGVELHAAHGMYLDEVIETSARTDEYGGPFENRIRLLVELIRELKEVCGDSFMVAVRLGNPDYDELKRTASAVGMAGADILDVSTGSEGYRDIPSDFPYDGKVYAASLVKRNAHIPVICVGNIFDGQTGEGILSAGYADMIAVGRGHLCDPAWAHKAMAGEIPNRCLRCRHCMWYIDGRKCPAVRGREKPV